MEIIVYTMTGCSSCNIIKELFQRADVNYTEYVLNKDIKNVDLTINKLFLEGYSMVNQIILFHNYILNLDITSEKKSDILCKLADIDQNLIKGCDEYIQFMKLIYHIIITL